MGMSHTTKTTCTAAHCVDGYAWPSRRSTHHHDGYRVTCDCGRVLGKGLTYEEAIRVRAGWPEPGTYANA